jgi:hypothetical protein
VNKPAEASLLIVAARFLKEELRIADHHLWPD